MKRTLLAVALTSFFLISAIAQQQQKPSWNEQEKPIVDQIRKLRSVPDDKRGEVTRSLAQQIASLPAGANKVTLITALAHLSTEGDPGRDALQAVADSLAAALRETPLPDRDGKPAEPYSELASLVRYEHVTTVLSADPFKRAMAELEKIEKDQAQVDFTLSDLNGKQWHLRDLKGKVVLLNFWATWCPPCRKEMPDLNELHKQFKDKGLVILSISDEKEETVRAYLSKFNYEYPILLDPGRAVENKFYIEGIPKTFVYDREGKLVTQSMDMRTKRQFLAMLAQAGLK